MFQLTFARMQMRLAATIRKLQMQLDIELNPLEATHINKDLLGGFKDQRVLCLTCPVLPADQNQTR